MKIEEKQKKFQKQKIEVQQKMWLNQSGSSQKTNYVNNMNRGNLILKIVNQWKMIFKYNKEDFKGCSSKCIKFFVPFGLRESE